MTVRERLLAGESVPLDDFTDEDLSDEFPSFSDVWREVPLIRATPQPAPVAESEAA